MGGGGGERCLCGEGSSKKEPELTLLLVVANIHVKYPESCVTLKLEIVNYMYVNLYT